LRNAIPCITGHLVYHPSITGFEWRSIAGLARDLEPPMSEIAERAYQSIKERIRGGDLPPGKRLVERSLCAELGMSRTPVREALRRLRAEGLAAPRPGRGLVVARLSPQELAELFELGLRLEGFVARLAARKKNKNNSQALDFIIYEMGDVLGKQDPDRAAYIRLDREFHLAIAAQAGNERVASMLGGIMDTRALQQVFSRYSIADLRVSLAQHETIARAIDSGDEDWAEAAMRSHILTGRAAGGA